MSNFRTPITKNNGRKVPLEIVLPTKNIISLHMDYRIAQMANYVCERVSQKATHPVEIGFLFGGRVTTTRRNDVAYNQIYIDDIYIPRQQRITQTTFNLDSAGKREARTYFLDKRMVGIGHSHARFDTFHSDVDHENCKTMVYSDSLRLQPGISLDEKIVQRQWREVIMTNPTNLAWLQHRARVQKSIARYTSTTRNNHSVSVIPSLVFNEAGSHIHAMLASSTYYRLDNGPILNDYDIRPIPVQFFNKNKEITSDDKRHIDYRVSQVLAYEPNKHLRKEIKK
ncbi:MAG TPA: hypothetical protein VK158_04265 [Acidobacteriota bacterium]|nr:hypothetical protein [Acidobacteriota bacterium]